MFNFYSCYQTIEGAKLAICTMNTLTVIDGLFYSRRASREMEGKNTDFMPSMIILSDLIE